jgi:hypothetical protein
MIRYDESGKVVHIEFDIGDADLHISVDCPPCVDVSVRRDLFYEELELKDLVVPARFQGGLLKVGQLSEEAYSQLFESLKRAPELSSSAELVAWMTDEVPAIASNDLKSMLVALASTARVQRNAEAELAKFAVDVWQSLLKTNPSDVKNLDGGSFRKRMASLIGLSSLELTSYKAASLRREVDKSFCRSKIFTDLRSVFKDKVDDAPAVMVLIHNLQIGYHDVSGEHRNFYVSLDTAELDKLKQTIDRARKKAKVLESALKTANITVID